jgi:hypothetical protein
MSYFYVSNPYSGSDELREQRALIAARVCGLLIKRDIHAWSPIVHNHAMMKTFNEFTLEERRSKILDFDFSLLRASTGMIVLTIPGWKESYGVGREIEVCRELNLPIKYLDPSALGTEKSIDECLKDDF